MLYAQVGYGCTGFALTSYSARGDVQGLAKFACQPDIVMVSKGHHVIDYNGS